MVVVKEIDYAAKQAAGSQLVATRGVNRFAPDNDRVLVQIAKR